jgi:hypothetical protein
LELLSQCQDLQTTPIQPGESTITGKPASQNVKALSETLKEVIGTAKHNLLCNRVERMILQITDLEAQLEIARAALTVAGPTKEARHATRGICGSCHPWAHAIHGGASCIYTIQAQVCITQKTIKRRVLTECAMIVSAPAGVSDDE